MFVKSRRHGPLTICTLVAVFALLTRWGQAVIVTDANTCARVGAPQQNTRIQVPGCDFNLNVLQQTFASDYSCEPSQAWMNQSGMFDFFERFYNESNPALYLGSCNDLSVSTTEDNRQCTYSLDEKCLVDEITSNSSLQESSPECYTPPLQLLRIFVNYLVGTFEELYSLVETYPKYCSNFTDSQQCETSATCIWKAEKPEYETPAVVDCEQSVTVYPPADSSHTGGFSLGYDWMDPPQNTSMIPFASRSAVVKEELEKLPSIGLVDVSRTSAIDSVSGERIFVYDITFPAQGIPKSPLNNTDQTAQVPQLEVIDTEDEVGAVVTTIVNGSGLIADIGIYYATDPLNSPCRINREYRDARILELGVDEKKLGNLLELDSAMERCASGVNPADTWNTAEDCSRVLFSTSSEQRQDMTPEELAEPGSTANSFCVWRSPDSTIQSDPTPVNVDPSQVVDFQWANNTYGGPSGLVRNANCSVPMIYQTVQLLKLFGLSPQELLTINRTLVDIDLNQQLSEQLSSFTEQYNTCFEDVKTIIQLPQPDFVAVWQKIVFTTCQTVAICYALAALVLAYRMQKMRFLSPKSMFKSILSTIGIVFIGAAIGFIMGFLLGCIPAAVISNIYASIPHNLPVASTVSLGVAQGLLILYFDCGRGIKY